MMAGRGNCVYSFNIYIYIYIYKPISKSFLKNKTVKVDRTVFLDQFKQNYLRLSGRPYIKTKKSQPSDFFNKIFLKMAFFDKKNFDKNFIKNYKNCEIF